MHARTHHFRQSEDRMLTSLMMALNSSFTLGLVIVLLLAVGIILAVRQP